MEYLLPILQTNAMSAIYPFLLCLLCFVLWMSRVGHRNTASKKRVAPEAAGAWPLIGHLHLLGGSQLQHIILGTLADEHGPIFGIRLGVHRALVVSTWELAKECFTTNNRAFSSRPKGVAMEHMGYNYAMFGFSPIGPYWRKMRRITTAELLSNHRLVMLNRVCETEVKASIKELYKLWVKNKTASDEVLVEMRKWFADISLNLTVRIVAGKRYVETNTMASSDGDRLHKALREFFELMGVFTVSDALPFLRWLDLGGYEKAMKKTAKELDSFLQRWLEEHKQKVSAGAKSEQDDFMDLMLSILDDDGALDESIFDVDTISKATCLTLFLGATDSISVTLTWALSLLLNNPHALKKAQEELDIHVGRERQVTESDINNLVYLQAILKETLRLYPAGQLLAPREAIEDCILGGYHVRAGTRLIVNLWKIHHDPRVWSDPFEFVPERFLTTHKELDVRGQHFELIPFGSGRRVCPGVSFALQITQLTLASLLHGFVVATPVDEPVDMSESFGLSNPKATPLEVLITPRLSAELYG
ncbi:cytochrome P450 CYP82D47-like [Cornus florida]|uniref:cytochrome P450 CYP82D47-like n=1 Tax=Cornus florida TaxID=4283 RepID=UPI0028A14AAC|nr:cytochrome P450 CYP82D47-like [Cornus florida]